MVIRDGLRYTAWHLINLLRVYRGCGAVAGNEQIFFAGAGRVRVMNTILGAKYLCGCGAGAGRLLRVRGGRG